jgi:hypothetical protein
VRPSVHDDDTIVLLGATAPAVISGGTGNDVIDGSAESDTCHDVDQTGPFRAASEDGRKRRRAIELDASCRCARDHSRGGRFK